MSRFSFDVDEEFAKKHNELLKDTRRLQLSAVLFALILLGVGTGLYFYLQKGGMGLIVLVMFGIMALISLSLIVVIPKQVGTAEQMYSRYELVPAVIAKVNPRDVILLALVNLNADPTLPPQYGLATRTITSIPNINRKVGERIPAVAVTGRRSTRNDETWDEISPMPIAWATQDEDVIKRAKAAIPHQDWNKLEKNMGKLDMVMETKFNLMPL